MPIRIWANDDIEVWRVSLTPPDNVRRALLASLSEDERARIARYHVPILAHRFAMRRGWLRDRLGKRLNTPPASLRFETSAFGKPFLAGRPVFFSASSRDDEALIAIADRVEVGVDIEEVATFDLTTMGHVLTDAECQRLNALPSDARPSYFTELWCAKEAAAKALGLGLRLPFGQLELREATVEHLPTRSRLAYVRLPMDEGWSGALVHR